MTNVYLEKLKLKGFRSYNSEREVTFPAGPGLTVIVGPNGLGKSTLFDAIEWGLTGELRRLDSMDAKAPEKKAALGKKPEVELWFNDAAHIYRSQTKAIISNTSAANVNQWLTAEKWRGVSSIADCLQLTHFLGQSSRQMFVHLDGKQRWALLEGPAGLQSLWKVEGTLGRKQTDLGFERVKENFLRDEAKLQEDIKRIQDMQEQLRVKRGLERADEILAPDEVQSRCERVNAELAIELRTTATTQDSPDSEAIDIDGILQSQRINMEAAEQQLANERTQLIQWTSLAQNYSDSVTKQTSLRQERAIAAHEYGAAEATATAASIQITLTASDHQSLVDRNTTQQNARDALIAEVDRNRQILTLTERLQASIRHSNDLTAKHSEYAEFVTTNKAILETLELRRSQHAQLLERSAALKALFVQSEGLLREDVLRSAARLELISLPASEATNRASLDEQRQILTHLQADENNFKLQKETAIAVSNAIAAGVAQIAAALREEDCICPVCQTTFALTGQLKELATQQANDSDERLVNIEEKISRQAEKINATQQKIFDLNASLARLQKRHEELTTLVLSADQLENTLRGAPILSGLEIRAFLPTLTAARDQNEKETKDLVSAISSNPDAIAVRTEIQRLSDLQQETISERDKLAPVLVNLERELEQLRSWPNSGRTAEQLQVMVSEIDSTLQHSSQNVLESQAKLDAAEANEASLKVRLAEKLERLDGIDTQITSFNQVEKDLAERWTRQGYENTPLPEAVRRIDESHEIRSVRLLRISQEHSILLEGYRRYLANAELQQLETTLKAECDQHQAKDIDSVIGQLTTQLAGVKKRQDMLSTVRQKRTHLMSQLKQKATDIRNTVSDPLNANTEKFCAALMSDRSHQVNLSAIASATTAQALLSFQPERKGAPKNPLLYMSEGQLAATSLCLLFGASATYPWSRWKGLLMDDPLHHNDSIHAAAFIDVVRNLIRSQGYQIIVSTHDMEQAGYFLRKCRNAGITTSYLHLYGRTEDGTALVQSA
ncbi:AAA family ATPase [Janthinobacterium sp. BJB304]|uniref:AAA family ATPase n=1 Tax=Janthinobacterium sp. BJB304 TaxID=1572871 RepID=UPI0015D4A977|nr:AAA family ATPase [Janthinobacterium sp. BJB304]